MGGKIVKNATSPYLGAENDKLSVLGNGQFIFFEKFWGKNWKKNFFQKKKIDFGGGTKFFFQN